MSAVVKLTFGYAGTDFTRSYAFECEPDILPDVKDAIFDVNDSIAAGTDGGLTDFFLSDDGKKFSGIKNASVIVTDEYPIDLNGGI